MSSMRADFYLQQEPCASDEEAKKSLHFFACRLIEKAYKRGHQVFVYCNNKHDAETMDELLWTYKEDSFIPHNLQGEGPVSPPPVQLGYDADPREFSDILLNLSDIIPSFHQRFRRIIEIVPNMESAKEICRLHYKTYRASGFSVQTHQLTT